MDNTLKFTGRANVYAKARPNYALEFIDFLYNDVGMNSSSIIADIGSGTGILSNALLEKGSTVYCVEPNNDMRKTAENNLSDFTNFHSVRGTAENTTIGTGCVDFIVVAQAFHWFNVENFKIECQRILNPNGKVILVWNSRVSTSEFVKENALICKKYCPNFAGFSGGVEHIDGNIAGFFNNNFELRRFSNDLKFDKIKFVERCMSASYSLKEADREFKSYIFELEALYEKYSVDDILTMPNETIAYIGKV